MLYWLTIPLVIAAVVTLLLSVYAWRRRSARGARPLIVLLLASSLWSMAYALELNSSTPARAFFWACVGYPGIVTAPVAWFAFALEYTTQNRWLTRRRIILLAIIPVLTTFFVWTQELHGLVWRPVRLDSVGSIAMLVLDYGPWFWVHIAYSYVLMWIGTARLIRTLLQVPRSLRAQPVLLVIAALLPWIANGVYVFGLTPLSTVDFTPLAFGLSGTLIARALFHYQLLDVMPVARDVVIDTMDDGVLVLDHKRRIVDCNPAARRLLDGALPNEAAGQSVEEVLPDFADLIADCYSVPETTVDLKYSVNGDERYYRLHVMTIGGDEDSTAGRLVLLRDISASVQTTRALHAQEQRFRSLVQNSSDVISIISSGGYVQYVSASVERILGYSPDKFIGTNIFDRIHPEDISVARETFGEVLSNSRDDSSVEYRFRHKDGSWRVLEVTGRNHLDDPAVGGIVVNARDVTERVRAERAVRRRAEELAALHANSLDITRLDDLDTLLATVVERATDLLDAPGGGLYLCDPEQGVVHCVVSYNTPQDYTGTVLSYGEGAAGTVAETGEPLIIDDYRRWHRRADAFEAEQPFTAVVSAPMAWRDEVIGVIHVLHETGDRQFDSEDLVLLTLFAEQAAIAVENARLLDAERRAVRKAQMRADELREREAYLRLLTDITSDALEARDLETLVQTLADRLGALIEDADGCYLTLWDERRQLPIPAAASGDLRQTYPQSELARAGESTLTAAVLQAGHAIAVENVYTSEHISSRIANQYPTHSLLGLPFIAGGEKLGAALIRFDTPYTFTEEQIERGEQAASQVALALAKVRGLKVAEHRAAELETLREAGAVVLATLDREEAIDRILEQLDQVVRYDTASVMLLRDGYLEIVGGHGWNELTQMVIGIRFPIPGDNPNTVVIQERRPHILEDAPAAYAAFREQPHSHIRSWLGVPLVVRDEVIGMLAIDSTEPACFTPHDKRLAAAFADQVAIAIANARLFAETRRLATTDELTGLCNRRHFFHLAEREFNRSRRQGTPISAIMLDIDRFKGVNDTHGHGVGDEILRRVAHRLEQAIREVDIIGRYGGEEFVVLLPDTERAIARKIAERLRLMIDDAPITTTGAGEIRVTLSAGVAQATEETSDPMALVDEADAALYAAKAAGRNYVRVR